MAPRDDGKAGQGHYQETLGLVNMRGTQCRGGLVFKAHRLVYHSTLGLRVIKRKKKGLSAYARAPWCRSLVRRGICPHIYALCNRNGVYTYVIYLSGGLKNGFNAPAGVPPCYRTRNPRSLLLFFFFTRVTGPRRSLSLKLKPETSTLTPPAKKTQPVPRCKALQAHNL